MFSLRRAAGPANLARRALVAGAASERRRGAGSERAPGAYRDRRRGRFRRSALRLPPRGGRRRDHRPAGAVPRGLDMVDSRPSSRVRAGRGRQLPGGGLPRHQVVRLPVRPRGAVGGSSAGPPVAVRSPRAGGALRRPVGSRGVARIRRRGRRVRRALPGRIRGNGRARGKAGDPGPDFGAGHEHRRPADQGFRPAFRPFPASRRRRRRGTRDRARSRTRRSNVDADPPHPTSPTRAAAPSPPRPRRTPLGSGIGGRSARHARQDARIAAGVLRHARPAG